MHDDPFYRLTFEVRITGAWYLGEVYDAAGQYILPITVTNGEWFTHSERLHVLVSTTGTPVDFRRSWTGVYIVSRRFAQVIETIEADAVQRIPLNVIDPESGTIVQSGEFEIMNLVSVVDALDWEKSTFERYPANEQQPHLAGRVRTISRFAFVQATLAGKHIFFLKDDRTYIIISRRMKQALEMSGLSGLLFMRLNQ